MIWAVIVFFIAGTRDAPAANDVTPVNFPRRVLGCFSFLLLLLIIVPVPRALYETLGLHSSYL
jgi:membrane-associated protease RseP (regulator of RpoE activity)